MFQWATFGKIKYDDKVFEHDIVVSTWGEVFPRPPREDNHLITKEQMESILDDHTKVVLVGNGQYSVLKVSDEAKQFLKKQKIALKVLPTPEAIKYYNKKMSGKGRKPSITAIMHLTC